MANAVITVLEADGTTETDVTVLDVGRQAAAASKSLTLATEDKAVLDAIAASLALIDNSIASGNELQVDVVGALPAGTNNIGDVDVLSVPAAVQTALDNIETAVEAIQVAAQIMDDWDESDRAKVNLIAGQAGITAGAGNVGASTPRVTLAADDPAVAALEAIEASVSDVAHDAADSGNPVKIGGYASAAAPTGVSGDGDRVNGWFLRNGAQMVGIQAAGALIPGDATHGLHINVRRLPGGQAEHVAASQTDQMMGATGAAGDYLEAVIIIPTSTSPGAVSIEDGDANIVIFDGGASSVSNLVPFRVDLGIYSVTGGWEITTGANVRAIGIGRFT
jgi:hypothetical protein